MDISGKVVLITGASMGIGRAAALRFAQAGARLALTARSVALLQEVAAEIRAAGGEVFTLSADLYAPDEARRVVTETLHHFGRLDILINNAGQAAAGDVERVSLEHFDRIMHLNVYAPLAAMQTAIPAMRAQGGGLVINVSSMVSKMHIPGLSAYAATKVALNMLTDTARGELAEEGIARNSLHASCDLQMCRSMP